jgi:two-component system chemotaxis response regulator CheB
MTQYPQSQNVKPGKNQGPAIRVMIADDSNVMREAISRLFEGDPDIQLIGEADTFVQTTQLIGELRPQVVVMDLHMPDENNMTPMHFKLCLNGTRLLAMSLCIDDETKALADTFGAVKLLDKMNLASELILAIKNCVTDGHATSL